MFSEKELPNAFTSFRSFPKRKQIWHFWFSAKCNLTKKMIGKPIYFSNFIFYLHLFTIYRAQLFYPFLLSASEFLSNLLFSYHLLYFCTALFLIIILSSNHLHKSKTLSQLTQCPFTGTLLLLSYKGETVHRQTDRQKQTDHNNPLLSSSVNNSSNFYIWLLFLFAGRARYH